MEISTYRFLYKKKKKTRARVFCVFIISIYYSSLPPPIRIDHKKYLQYFCRNGVAPLLSPITFPRFLTGLRNYFAFYAGVGGTHVNNRELIIRFVRTIKLYRRKGRLIETHKNVE